MGIIRPATPGFLVTLVACALLAVVSFCVPYFKSVYFLKASIIEGNTTLGSITFGTLGYCLELPGNSTCSKPSVGYELDINSLVGNKLPFEIPQVAVKWITYALVLHVVALALAVGSAIFGLLAHVREMSMTCCSTCVSGFAAAVAMLAFIFDLVLFFVARARINAVGSATMGTAIWLTLAAWVLLFFSGCFYTLGRCCASKRSSGEKYKREVARKKEDEENYNSGYQPPRTGGGNDYAERLRLDAVKAEADRKNRAKIKEGGLPAFAENETQPLTAVISGDHVYLDNDASSAGSISTAGRKPSSNTLNHSQSATFAAGGYVQGAPGTRAVDEYYNPTTTPAPQGPNTYPPQPQSAYAAYGHPPQRQPSGYTPGSAPPAGGYGGGYGGGGGMTTSPPPSQMLNVPGAGYNDPYSAQGQAYGHTHGGSSYHTAMGGHSQQPSAVGYDAYDQQYQNHQQSQQQHQQTYYSPQPNAQYTARENPAFLAPHLTSSPPPQSPSPYGPGASVAPTALATAGYSPNVSNTSHSHGHSPQQQMGVGSGAYDAPYAYNPHGNERQYTLSGDGYGESSVPALPTQGSQGGYDPYYAGANANPYLGGGGQDYSGSQQQQMQQPEVGGGRGAGFAVVNRDEQEAPPPGYDAGDGRVQGRWGKS